MAQPVTPSMLEFMDDRAVQLARAQMCASTGQSDIPAHVGALLMIEADGDAGSLPHALDALIAAARGDGCLDIEPAVDETARERLWAARKALSPALRSLAPGKINEDVVVPVSRIPELVAGVQTLSQEFSLPIVCFGHAGNGNLHVNLMYDPADPAQNAHAHTAMARVFALTLSLGGTLSGEHGIGLAKRGFMAQAIDAPTLAMMRAVKGAFDPDGILNPGKLLP
jgi:D-lactate dehydrogenase (quinone)